MQTTPRGNSKAGSAKIAYGLAGVAVLAVILIASSVAGWPGRLLRRPRTPQIRSLAVLPFENLSGSTEQDYFADGMTDALITDLGQIPALRVISRTSVMKYRAARRPLADIAGELHVDAVIEGSVSRSQNLVLVTARLVYAPSYQRRAGCGAERRGIRRREGY